MPTIRHKLGNTINYTYQQVLDKVKNGGRFVVYQYTISFIALTLRRLTPAYFIDVGEDASKYAGRANSTSSAFGWWGLPWGPIWTMQSLKLNKKGGVDVTKDIVINLTEEAYNAGFVTIEKLYNPYTSPNKTEEKYLRKSLEAFMTAHPGVKEMYFAVQTNAGSPAFVIGMPMDVYEEDNIDELKKILKKYFMVNARFEFICLIPGKEETEKLMECGGKVGWT